MPKIIPKCCIFLLVTIIFVSPLLPYASSPSPKTHWKGHSMRVLQEEIKYPLIFIAKKPSKRNVSIGEWFDIAIMISNIGNDTAYNLTIIDENYPEWSIRTENYSGIYFIDTLRPNASVIIKYRICIVSSAQQLFSLGRVLVHYYDSKGSKFVAISSESIVQIEKPRVEVNIKYVSRVLLMGGLILILPAIIVLIYGDYRVYREYMKLARR